MHGKSKFPLILVKSVFLIKLGAAAFLTAKPEGKAALVVTHVSPDVKMQMWMMITGFLTLK